MGLKDRIKKFDKDKFRPEILDEATVQTNKLRNSILVLEIES